MCTLSGEFARPKLFNWVTVMLLTAWLLTVLVVVESTESQPRHQPESVQTFLEELLT